MLNEWQESAQGEGKSLIDVQGSVGLILYDVVEALRLPPHQQRAILGTALYVEIKEYFYSTAQLDQPIIQGETR